MMRSIFMIAAAALAILALAQSVRQPMPTGLAAPSRTTVIVKNSPYPRLNRDGLANRGFDRGQWI